jgi:hypothetical protein
MLLLRGVARSNNANVFRLLRTRLREQRCFSASPLPCEEEEDDKANDGNKVSDDDDDVVQVEEMPYGLLPEYSLDMIEGLFENENENERMPVEPVFKRMLENNDIDFDVVRQANMPPGAFQDMDDMCSEEHERTPIAIKYREVLGYKQGGDRPMLKDATKEKIYEQYMSDPETWTVNRLSETHGLRRSRVIAILLSKRSEYEDVEKLRGGKPFPSDLQRAIEREIGAVNSFDDRIELSDSAPGAPEYSFADSELNQRRASRLLWEGRKRYRKKYVPEEEIPRVPTANVPPPEILDGGLLDSLRPPRTLPVMYVNWDPDVHPIEEFAVIHELDGTFRTPTFAERIEYLFRPMFNLLPPTARLPENAVKIHAAPPLLVPDPSPPDYIKAFDGEPFQDSSISSYGNEGAPWTIVDGIVVGANDADEPTVDDDDENDSFAAFGGDDGGGRRAGRRRQKKQEFGNDSIGGLDPSNQFADIDAEMRAMENAVTSKGSGQTLADVIADLRGQSVTEEDRLAAAELASLAVDPRDEEFLRQMLLDGERLDAAVAAQQGTDDGGDDDDVASGMRPLDFGAALYRDVEQSNVSASPGGVHGPPLPTWLKRLNR